MLLTITFSLSYSSYYLPNSSFLPTHVPSSLHPTIYQPSLYLLCPSSSLPHRSLPLRLMLKLLPSLVTQRDPQTTYAQIRCFRCRRILYLLALRIRFLLTETSHDIRIQEKRKYTVLSGARRSLSSKSPRKLPWLWGDYRGDFDENTR